MKATDTTVIFACNPLGSHWIAVRITQDGGISVSNSLITAQGTALTMAILQRALPSYAKLVSMRPSSQLDLNAFEGSRVIQQRSAQQGNESDCGPATLATISHIVNDKPHETSIDGEGLRSSHLRVLHHYVHGFGSQQWPLSHFTGAAGSGPQHLTRDDPAVIDTFDSGHSFLERFQISFAKQDSKLETRAAVHCLERHCNK